MVKKKQFVAGERWIERAFLNEGDEEGVAAARVTFYPRTRDETDAGWSANVTISDCSRQVSLDFDAYSKEQQRARLKKIRLLIDMLCRLENGMFAAAQNAKRRAR